MSGAPPPSHGRRWRSAGVAAVVTGGLYVVLIDTRTVADLLAGAIIVAIATGAFVISREREAELFTHLCTWLRETGAAFRRVPADLVRLTGIALRQSLRPGSCQSGWERRAVAGDTAAERARREITGSLAPGEIVIGHDEETGELIVHRIGAWR